MKNRILIILFAFAVLAMSGCKKSEDTPTELSDAQSAMITYQSFSVVFAQVQFTPMDQAYGNVNQTITSPDGGKVVVTGTCTYDEVSSRVNWMLTFGYWSYRIVTGSSTDFTQNGTVTVSGFVNTAGTMQMRLTCPKASMKGKINEVPVNTDWYYNFLINASNGKGTLTGEFNGRSFSYSF